MSSSSEASLHWLNALREDIQAEVSLEERVTICSDFHSDYKVEVIPVLLANVPKLYISHTAQT